MERKMFCYQCQEAAKNIGCEIIGVCGKVPTLATEMDAVKYVIKGLSVVANDAEAKGVDVKTADYFIMDSLFKLITNGNFDEADIARTALAGIQIREKLKEKFNGEYDSEALNWTAKNVEEVIEKGLTVGVHVTKDDDIRSARATILYGLMGAAAYHSHASKLGFTSEQVFKSTRKGLASMLDDSLSLMDYVDLIDETGATGVEVMALLDKANNTFGTPEISKVNIGVGTKPGILITGHDLHDMKMLLDQSKDTGVDIYTHSEMLPSHYYPEFKKYDNLFGNYGGAWHDQREIFESFNGPVLFTSNCIVPPTKNATYNDRIYTTGNTGYPGWKHIEEKVDGTKDFSEIIKQAQKCDPPEEIESGAILGGFAHAQVINLADKVVEAVKSGAITKFVVMGGCDGRFQTRKYYTEFAKALPDSTVILTAGCAKFRYNKIQLGEIDGIPRVLDAGQCNDSYSLAVIAMKLAEVFECDINDLPIVYNIAWYEQKALIVLLSLLHLGIKNIHVGPTLPAFLSENVGNFLVDTYNLGSITTVEEDIERLILN
ncbi:hydroxylamine reductase [Mycoplasmatota bacterium WC44]